MKILTKIRMHAMIRDVSIHQYTNQFSLILEVSNEDLDHTVQLIPHVLYWGQIKSVRYRDEILRPVAVPLVQQRNLILQQDNARPHVARVCQDFLANITSRH